MNRIYIILLFLFFVSSVNLFAQKDKDTPRNGEGIHSFLKRNKRNADDHYDLFRQLNKGKFGKKNSLLKGVSYTLPSLSDKKKTIDNSSTNTQSGKTRTYKLFGKDYEKYTVKSNKLKGACFYLSSGHGGPDPGAVGKIDGYEVHEDEYAYDITLRLARALMEEGATVHMIIQDAVDGIRDDRYLANSNRETCMGEAIPLNQVKRLRQRSNKINSLARRSKEKYKRAIFIHVDSRSQNKQLDVFFYHAKNSTAGKKLATRMRQTFSEHYDKHQPTRGFTGTVTPRSLYMLDNTSPVGIYAELGNIQNSFDQRRFLDPNNRQALANWMCRGFIKDYESWKKGN
ncbi:N-acetylmuramoyl-L-alanine amidase [Prevotella sp. 10(H)]|uniref:N-acetylmuramoyl-L-alanine amidase family protein n=1 Tax=Prevotella sp. 10(H) TaxID=1158294 RepID=UPI0004A7530A|nr:N-acetylmuramoyl-L-alanine amidase [Prevotella sp. 10(H)]